MTAEEFPLNLLKPWSVIEIPGINRTRIFNIEGVYLGALEQEDCVGLSPMDTTPRENNTEMMVPLDLIRSAWIAGILTITETPE